MSKKNNSTWIWVIVTGILVLFILPLGSGGKNLLGSAALLSFPGTVGTPNTQVSSSLAAACQSANQKPSITLLASHPAQNSGNKQTFDAAPYNVVVTSLISGPTTPFLAQAGVTSGTGAATFVNGTVPCGASGIVYFGASDASSGNYMIPVAFGPAQPGQNPVQTTAMPVMATLSAATISNYTASVNALGTSTSLGVTAGKVVSAGGGTGTFILTLTTGAGQFGENGTYVTLVYNGVALNQPSVIGPNGQPLQSTSYQLPGAANVVTGETSKTFIWPTALSNWNTQYTFQISATTQAAFGANTAIGIYLNDPALVFNTGAAASGTQVSAINPTSSADIGLVGIDYGNANTLTAVPGFGQNTLNPDPILICIQAGCK